MINDTDIAWCAGFFDGEGCVKYYRQYPNENTGHVSAVISCSIAQKSDNIETLQFFQSIIPFGSIKGPYAMPNGKPQHRLVFSVDEVETLFEILKPYLKSEKTQAFNDALFSYQNHNTTTTIEDRMRANRRDIKKLRK